MRSRVSPGTQEVRSKAYDDLRFFKAVGGKDSFAEDFFVSGKDGVVGVGLVDDMAGVREGFEPVLDERSEARTDDGRREKVDKTGLSFKLLHEGGADGRPVGFLAGNKGLLQAGVVVEGKDGCLAAHMGAALSEGIGGIAFYFDGPTIPDFCQDRLENLPVKEGSSVIIRDTWNVFSRLFYIGKGVFDGGFFAGSEDSCTDGDAAELEKIPASRGKLAVHEVFYWDIFVGRLHISSGIWSIPSRQSAQPSRFFL